jgi:hypothetical protein
VSPIQSAASRWKEELTAPLPGRTGCCSLWLQDR